MTPVLCLRTSSFISQARIARYRRTRWKIGKDTAFPVDGVSRRCHAARPPAASYIPEYIRGFKQSWPRRFEQSDRVFKWKPLQGMPSLDSPGNVLRCQFYRRQQCRIGFIRRLLVQTRMRSRGVVPVQMPVDACTRGASRFVGVQVHLSSHFTVRHSRSTNTLSRHAPRPSMESLQPRPRTAVVNSAAVN